jgi:hypothetical protein
VLSELEGAGPAGGYADGLQIGLVVGLDESCAVGLAVDSTVRMDVVNYAGTCRGLTSR